MSRYNTGNPIDSDALKDLSDNAKNADLAVNSNEPTFKDRFNKNRKTYAGMEQEFNASQSDRDQRFRTFIASSGYEFVGEYAGGITLTEYNQVLRDAGGEFWRAAGATTLPYTTTGAGVDESGKLSSVGDAALRQELAGSPADGLGAALVDGAVVRVADATGFNFEGKPNTVYLLEQYRKQHPADEYVGGGLFVWDGAKRKTDHDGGTVFSSTATWDGTFASLPSFQAGVSETDPSGFGCFVRVRDYNYVHVDWFGPRRILGYSATVETSAALQNAIDCAGNDGTVEFGNWIYVTATPMYPRSGQKWLLNSALITKQPAVTTDVVADLAVDDKSCQVADSSGLKAGMSIAIYDNTQEGWNATYAVIDSVSGNIVNFTQSPKMYFFGGTVGAGVIQPITASNGAKLCATHPLIVPFSSHGLQISSGRLDGNVVTGEFPSFPCSAIHASLSNGIFVDGTTISNCAQDAVSDQQSFGNTYRGLTIDNIGWYGIHVGTAGGQHRLTGNNIRNVGLEAIHYSIGVKGCIVSDNHIKNSAKGIANLTFGNDDNVITNNTIEGCPVALEVIGGYGNNLSDNTIRGGQIRVENASLYTKVVNNTVYSEGLSGVYVGAGAWYTEVVGNTLLEAVIGVEVDSPSFVKVNANSIHLTTGDGIRVNGGTQNAVKDNTVRCEAGYGISATSTAITVTGNTVLDAPSGAVLVAGDSMVVSRNQLISGSDAITVTAQSKFGTIADNTIANFVGSIVKINTTTPETSDMEIRDNYPLYGPLAITNDYGNATGLLLNGTGDNGNIDPALGGYWNARGRIGVVVIWRNGGNVYQSRYVDGEWVTV